MAELADAQVSKTCGSDPIVWVRFPPAAQIDCWPLANEIGGRWLNGRALHSHCRGWEFDSPPVHKWVA